MKKQKLINFKKDADFQKDLQAGELLETSIIFVDDTKKIYTHNTEFDGNIPDWNAQDGEAGYIKNKPTSLGGEADWDAEEGDAGYIKNKPFEDVVTDSKLFSDSLTFSAYSGDTYMTHTEGIEVEFTEGTYYQLRVDNKPVYVFQISSLVKDPKETFILTETDENQYSLQLKQDSFEGTTHQVDIVEVEVRQIDSRYLPIVQENGDSETKIMSQKAITEELGNKPFTSNGRGGATLMNAQNTNNGNYGTVEGYNNSVNGDYAHAEGFKSKTLADNSHVEGSNCTIESGNASHAEGYMTWVLSGQGAHAEGNQATAQGHYAHAEGGWTQALADGAHAENFYTEASGKYSHAEGNKTKAKGQESHAEGNSAEAIGNYSHAEGLNTRANSSGSHAEGHACKATGDYSHAEGHATQTLNTAEHASGRYNIPNQGASTFGDSTNTLFSVGNGDSYTAHNAFEVRQNGDFYIADTKAEGEYNEKPMIKLQDCLIPMHIITAADFDRISPEEGHLYFITED